MKVSFTVDLQLDAVSDQEIGYMQMRLNQIAEAIITALIKLKCQTHSEPYVLSLDRMRMEIDSLEEFPQAHVSVAITPESEPVTAVLAAQSRQAEILAGATIN